MLELVAAGGVVEEEVELLAVVGLGLADSVRDCDCADLGCIIAKCLLESCWRTGGGGN